MILYDPFRVVQTKYLFLTGKGGVGKTSVACATAVALADAGKKVLLISTDPASNLQDVFSMELTNKATAIDAVPNLAVANLDPVQAAAEYRESVIGPYRGLLPEAALRNMEEQLSGSCTVEIAAFNEFTNFLTDETVARDYDHILFDTAPTGHTLRMLQLPSAWSQFIQKSKHGASCLGQLSGLESRKELYKQAVQTLADRDQTTMLLVARPDDLPLKEAARASKELAALGIANQQLIINGLLASWDDDATKTLYEKQQAALQAMPEAIANLPRFQIPLRTYNITGLDHVRALLKGEVPEAVTELALERVQPLQAVIDDLEASHRKVIFTMGKGGVGKTTVAAAIALGLARRGHRVHLTTTDPAAHLQYVVSQADNLTLSHIDEGEELKKYQAEVLSQAKANGLGPSDLAYIEEDLRSPCTQEIAVFHAFADRPYAAAPGIDGKLRQGNPPDPWLDAAVGTALAAAPEGEGNGSRHRHLARSDAGIRSPAPGSGPEADPAPFQVVGHQQILLSGQDDESFVKGQSLARNPLDQQSRRTHPGPHGPHRLAPRRSTRRRPRDAVVFGIFITWSPLQKPHPRTMSHEPRTTNHEPRATKKAAVFKGQPLFPISFRNNTAST